MISNVNSCNSEECFTGSRRKLVHHHQGFEWVNGGDVYFRLCFRKISTDFCYLGCDLGEIQKVHSRLFKQCFSQMVCYLSIQLKLRTRRIRFGSKNNSWVKTAGAQHFKHCSFWRQMTWGQIVIGVW